MVDFKKHQNLRIVDKDGNLVSGEFFLENNLIVRIKNGYLNDSEGEENNVLLPAVEAIDGSYIEHWVNGLLHCDRFPAIIDNVNKVEEWWFNGVKVEPKEY